MSERRSNHATSIRIAGSLVLGASGVLVRMGERDWQMLPLHPIWSWIAGTLLVGCTLVAVGFGQRHLSTEAVDGLAMTQPCIIALASPPTTTTRTSSLG